MFVIANWKMNLTAHQVAAFLDKFNALLAKNSSQGVKIGLAPSFTELNVSVRQVGLSSIWIGAQHISSEISGAYTGEISARQLKALGVRFVLIGHSERRIRWPESPDLLTKQLTLAIEAGLTPVFCIGELYAQREQLEIILAEQLVPVIETLQNKGDFEMYIAYEPVWAIGTGLTPSLNDITQAHRFIGNHIFELTDRYIPVLYGGSVSRENAQSLAGLSEVQGLLVGGASLDPDHFWDIIQQCKTLAD